MMARIGSPPSSAALEDGPPLARGFYARRGKRWLDVAVAAPLLVALSPVLAALALAVRLGLGSPVLFRQERVGRSERVFRLNKFRTMTDARDAAGRLLPDAERLTALGFFLRRWSLDELPQLLNVVAGDMSLIGPRPLLVRYLPRYAPRQRRRHETRPGITGWAQVNGRNRLGWAERFEHDVWYAERCSLALDIKIVWLTLARAFRKEAVAAGGGAEVDEFWGVDGPPLGVTVRSLPAEATAAAELSGWVVSPEPDRTRRPAPTTPRTVAGAVGWEEGTLPVLTEAEAAARKDSLGHRVTLHRGRYWTRVAPGFWQPVHVLARLDAREATRPSPGCWGFRARLDEADAAGAANALLPVHLLPEPSAYGVDRLSSEQRRRLRRTLAEVDLVVLTAPDILLDQGHAVAREAKRLSGGLELADAARFRRWMLSFFEPRRGLVLAALRSGRLLGFCTTIAVDGTAYQDRLLVGAEGRRAHVSLAFFHASAALACRTPGVGELANGLHMRESPGLCEFKRGLGLGLARLPARSWTVPAAGALLRHVQPHVHHRLTGRD